MVFGNGRVIIAQACFGHSHGRIVLGEEGSLLIVLYSAFSLTSPIAVLLKQFNSGFWLEVSDLVTDDCVVLFLAFSHVNQSLLPLEIEFGRLDLNFLVTILSI